MKMLEDLEEVVRNESRADQGCWRMWANQLRSGPKNSADLDKSDLIADFTGARTHNLNFVQSLVLWFRTHHATIADMAARLEAAESECLEQARLNGMGSEREAALTARLEAAEKDAARYRWLRDLSNRKPGGVNITTGYNDGESYCLWNEGMDAAIDAAMQETGR